MAYKAYKLLLLSYMRYIINLRAEVRSLLARLRELPTHPYSPFYARWEMVLHLRMQLLRQHAHEERQARALGMKKLRGRWVVPEPLDKAV